MNNIQFDTVSQVVIHAEKYEWVQRQTGPLLHNLEHWFNKDLARFDLAEYNSCTREVLVFLERKCYRFNNLNDIEDFFKQHTGKTFEFVFKLKHA